MSIDSSIWLKKLNNHCLQIEGVPVWRLVEHKYIIECARRNMEPEDAAHVLCFQRLGRQVPVLEEKKVPSKPTKILPESEDSFDYLVTSPILSEPIKINANATQLKGLIPMLEQKFGYEFEVRSER